MYSIVNDAVVLSKEILNNGRVLVTLKCDPFTSTTDSIVSSISWPTGTCDNLQGSDGVPNLSMNYKMPFRIQGIELMHGLYEFFGDIKAKHISKTQSETGVAYYDVYCVYDINNATTSGTTSYEIIGRFPSRNTGSSASSWIYPSNIQKLTGGGLFPEGSGGSTSTGIGDAFYSVGGTSAVTAVCLNGYLHSNGSKGGLFCVSAITTSTTTAYKTIGSRLSFLARSAP